VLGPSTGPDTRSAGHWRSRRRRPPPERKLPSGRRRKMLLAVTTPRSGPRRRWDWAAIQRRRRRSGQCRADGDRRRKPTSTHGLKSGGRRRSSTREPISTTEVTRCRAQVRSRKTAGRRLPAGSPRSASQGQRRPSRESPATSWPGAEHVPGRRWHVRAQAEGGRIRRPTPDRPTGRWTTSSPEVEHPGSRQHRLAQLRGACARRSRKRPSEQ